MVFVLLVSFSTFLLETGIAGFIQMLGIGMANLLCGVVKDHGSYDDVLMLLFLFCTISLLCAIIASYLDSLNGGPLNKLTAKKNTTVEPNSNTNE